MERHGYCYEEKNITSANFFDWNDYHMDYVVIDGEAGIEQINRRVMENITYLVLVSDGSKKGIQVISVIEDVAKKLTNYKKSGVIFNRTRGSFDAASVSDIPVMLSVIGDDENQAENDMQGESVFNLPVDSPLYKGAEKALRLLLEGECL